MKNISFIHYYRKFGDNMGTKRSKILQESQFFLIWCAVFQSKLSKLQETLKHGQKCWLQPIFSGFSKFVQFGLKKKHQTQKIDFPKEFCFFWYPYCPQTRDKFYVLFWYFSMKAPSGAFSSFFQNEAWCHLV